MQECVSQAGTGEGMSDEALAPLSCRQISRCLGRQRKRQMINDKWGNVAEMD